MRVPLNMTGQDVAMLIQYTYPWADDNGHNPWREHPDRFAPFADSEPINWQHRHAHWLGGEWWTPVMLVREYLTAIGQPCQILRDNQDMSWVITTDHSSFTDTPAPTAPPAPVTVPDSLRELLAQFENRSPTDIAKIDDELVHTLCGEVLCDVEDGDSLTTLVDVALHHTCPTTTITLTHDNRAEVIAFITGPDRTAAEANDPDTGVITVDLPDRREIVILGETVTRTSDEFRIGQGDSVRTTFPRLPDPNNNNRDADRDEDHRAPGTRVVERINHPEFDIDGTVYYVEELRWNGTDGRSYDLYRLRDNEIINDGVHTESWDDYPTREEITDQIRAYLEASEN